MDYGHLIFSQGKGKKIFIFICLATILFLLLSYNFGLTDKLERDGLEENIPRYSDNKKPLLNKTRLSLSFLREGTSHHTERRNGITSPEQRNPQVENQMFSQILEEQSDFKQNKNETSGSTPDQMMAVANENHTASERLGVEVEKTTNSYENRESQSGSIKGSSIGDEHFHAIKESAWSTQNAESFTHKNKNNNDTRKVGKLKTEHLHDETNKDNEDNTTEMNKNIVDSAKVSTSDAGNRSGKLKDIFADDDSTGNEWSTDIDHDGSIKQDKSTDRGRENVQDDDMTQERNMLIEDADNKIYGKNIQNDIRKNIDKENVQGDQNTDDYQSVHRSTDNMKSNGSIDTDNIVGMNKNDLTETKDIETSKSHDDDEDGTTQVTNTEELEASKSRGGDKEDKPEKGDAESRRHASIHANVTNINEQSKISKAQSKSFQSPWIVDKDFSVVSSPLPKYYLPRKPITFAHIEPCGPQLRSINKECRGESLMFQSRCRTSDCVLVEDYESADIVVINAYRIETETEMPIFRRPQGQIWVMYTQEPAFKMDHYSMLDFPFLSDSFNLTVTYLSRSDIWDPYSFLYYEEELSQVKDYESIYKGKTIHVAWFVSHCHTQSQREQYVNRMMAYNRVEIHIFGKCGAHNCSGYSISKSLVKQELDNKYCFPLLSEKYHFYLAFENSFCEDYVTEKVFKVFQDVDVIPVVRGGIDYHKYFPSGTFIDTSDFRSPESLSDYLYDLARDKERYIKMLMEKNRYKAKYPDKWFCSLCFLLRDGLQPKTYNDIRKWFVPQNCSEPSDL